VIEHLQRPSSCALHGRVRTELRRNATCRAGQWGTFCLVGRREGADSAEGVPKAGRRILYLQQRVYLLAGPWISCPFGQGRSM
jgi:hypothetical protein